MEMKQENFIVITFDDQDKAIEASHKLQDLAMHNDVSIGYNLLLRKGEDGKVEALKKESKSGRDTWMGLFLGMLVGLFFGPFGFIISMLAGMGIGAGLDSSQYKSEESFANKAQEELDKGKIAIIAQVNESNPIFVDDAMKALGGDVHRMVS